MKLTREEARAIVYNDNHDWESLESCICDTSRWSIHYESIHIHKPTGKHYRFYYSRGTEVEAEEVHQVEKLVKVWEPVAEAR